MASIRIDTFNTSTLQYSKVHLYRQYSRDNSTGKNPKGSNLDIATTCKFTPQKILPKRSSYLSPCVVMHYLVAKLCRAVLSKTAINCWIISWYTSAVIVVNKKLVPLHICDSWCTKRHFFGDATILFKKCECSWNSKHDNFAHLWVCSHLNETRLHHWRRVYQTTKHHCVHSDKVIDKTLLFSVNRLNLTRVDLKFCTGWLWNKVYIMLTCVKALPAVPVMITWWAFCDFLCNRLPLLKVIIDSCPKYGKSSRFCFHIFLKIKFSIAWLFGVTEFGNSCIKSSQTHFNECVS